MANNKFMIYKIKIIYYSIKYNNLKNIKLIRLNIKISLTNKNNN